VGVRPLACRRKLCVTLTAQPRGDPLGSMEQRTHRGWPPSSGYMGAKGKEDVKTTSTTAAAHLEPVELGSERQARLPRHVKCHSSPVPPVTAEPLVCKACPTKTFQARAWVCAPSQFYPKSVGPAGAVRTGTPSLQRICWLNQPCAVALAGPQPYKRPARRVFVTRLFEPNPCAEALMMRDTRAQDSMCRLLNIARTPPHSSIDCSNVPRTQANPLAPAARLAFTWLDGGPP
jgi:hypothetical protein